MSVVVLDAWAALAFLQREGQAAVIVRRLLRRAARGNVRLSMNVVNLGEVYYHLIQIAGEEQADVRLQRFRRLPIDVLPAREGLALSAARPIVRVSSPTLPFGGEFRKVAESTPEAKAATVQHRKAKKGTGTRPSP